MPKQNGMTLKSTRLKVSAELTTENIENMKKEWKLKKKRKFGLLENTSSVLWIDQLY